MKIAVAMFAMICFCSTALAEDKAHVEMVANVSAIAPGQPFMVGFKFTITPGWHIYWKNPGDSGLPTQVKLNLPEGFTASELMFPVPTRLQLPGDIVNYAYENQAVFLMRITPPKDLPVGKSVKLNGRASWLVCQDVCMPGKADVSIELPVAASATPANADLFNQWSSQLPVKENADPEEVASVYGSYTLSGRDGQASIDITWRKTPSEIQYIPGPLHDGDISDVKVTTTGDSTKITFAIKSFKDDEPVTGLVVFTSAAGMQRAMDISIPYGAGGPR